MRLKQTENRTVVTLSRRNVLALLHKLDMPGSAREIQKVEGDVLLCLRVEDDAVHYDHPERDVPGRVGPMHPATEQFIQTNERTPA